MRSHEIYAYISNFSSSHFSLGGTSSHSPSIFFAMLMSESATRSAKDCSPVLFLFDVYPTRMKWIVNDLNSIQGYLNCLHDLRPGEAEGWGMGDFVCKTEDFTCDVHDAGCIVRADFRGFGNITYHEAVLCSAGTQHAACTVPSFRTLCVLSRSASHTLFRRSQLSVLNSKAYMSRKKVVH